MVPETRPGMVARQRSRARTRRKEKKARRHGSKTSEILAVIAGPFLPRRETVKAEFEQEMTTVQILGLLTLACSAWTWFPPQRATLEGE